MELLLAFVQVDKVGDVAAVLPAVLVEDVLVTRLNVVRRAALSREVVEGQGRNLAASMVVV